MVITEKFFVLSYYHILGFSCHATLNPLNVFHRQELKDRKGYYPPFFTDKLLIPWFFSPIGTKKPEHYSGSGYTREIFRA